MDITVTPTKNFAKLLPSWAPKPTETTEPEVCPVCLSDKLQVEAQPCKHQFCPKCLIICVKAKPYETLPCPVCRQTIIAQVGLDGLEVERLPPMLLPQQRPRVNEKWLTEQE